MPVTINGSGAITGMVSADSSDLGTALAAKAAKAGAVIQVVQATTSSTAASSSSTYADTGLSATITPSSTSSKVLVIVSHATQKSSANANNHIGLRLVRGSTTIATIAASLGYTGTALDVTDNFGYSYLDSPATTSATTYKTTFANPNNTATVYIAPGGEAQTMLLLEIGG